MQVVERHFEKTMLRPSGAACAMRVLGRQDDRIAVSPERPVYLVVTASGLANMVDYRADAIRRAAQATDESLAALIPPHQQWWNEFWAKSFVEVSDKVLEQRYYLSNYCLASASRLAHFPPALYGWVTDDEQQWGGAYFNNYNFIAPFYGLYAGNHLEQTAPCNDPILDFLASGREWCRKECNLNSGIVLPVSMLPLGITGAPTTWHQRSNAPLHCPEPLARQDYSRGAQRPGCRNPHRTTRLVPHHRRRNHHSIIKRVTFLQCLLGNRTKPGHTTHAAPRTVARARKRA